MAEIERKWLARVLGALMMVLVSAPPPALAAIDAGAEDSGADAARFYEDGLRYFNQGKFDAAIIQLKNALQQAANNLPARLLLGKVYIELGDGPSAEKELSIARKNGADDDLVLAPLAKALFLQGNYAKIFDLIRPGGRAPEVDAKLHVIRGDAHLELRELDKAEQSYVAAARLAPDLVEPLLGQARVLVNRGDLAGAEQFANRAALLRPDDEMAWFVKGEIDIQQRQLDEALANFDRAVALRPKFLDAHLSRAATLIDLRREDDAIEDLKYVLAAAPSHPQAAYLYALILARKGKINDAQAVLAEATMAIANAEPDYLMNNAPSLLLAGVLNYAQGNADDALLYLGRYIELYPYHAGSRKMLASVLIDRGEFARAKAVIEPAVKLAPDDPEVYSVLGTTLMGTKEYTQASAMFEKAAALAPKKARLRTELALSRLATGNNDAAVEDLQSAVALDPKATRPGILLGLVQLRRGNFKKAIEAARALIERDPENPLAHNMAGAAYLGLRQPDAARAQLEKAVEVAPDYLPARFNLAQIDRTENKIEDAKRRYREILKIKPDETRAMLELSRVAEREGKLGDAADWLEEMRNMEPDKLGPQLRLINVYLRARRPEAALIVAREIEAKDVNDPNVLATLARAELAAGEYFKATQMFRDLAERVADDPAALHRVARLQISAEDWVGARKTLGRALRAKPGFLAARITRIDLEARAGNIDTALDLARKLRAEHPEMAAADLVYGDALMRAKRFDEAAAAYETGLGKEPNSGLVLRVYRARLRAGESDRAMTLLEGWVRDNPDDASARKALAAAYIGAKRFDDAIALHERILKASPDNAGILNNLAWLYQRTGDPRAVDYAKRAYQQAPNDAAMIDTYGWILVQNDDPKRGLRLLRDAHARASKNPEVRYHLAVALAKLGRDDEARAELEKILDTGAEFEGIADARALLLRLKKG